MIDQDQIRRARQANLVSYLVNKGYKLKRDGQGGNYRLVGHQGLIIQENHFFRFGGGEKGNAIDFLVKIEGKTFSRAVEELLGIGCTTDDRYFGITKSVKQRKDFELPAAAANNKRIINYLKHRGIPEKFVNEIIQKGLVYPDLKGNCVFPCMDSRGQSRGAILRGTTNVRWVGVAAESDVSYPWVLKLQGMGNGTVITESPIDAMSFLAIYPQTQGYIIALGGLREKSISNFLAKHPEVTEVVLALDNDQPGRGFAQEQFEKLDKEYEVSVLHPPMGDWNEFLLSAPPLPSPYTGSRMR